jgi:hypothetical protein
VDSSRFDRIAKQLALRPSRRSLLKSFGKAGLTAVSIGATGLISSTHETDAAACRDSGVTCIAHGQCCSHSCGEPDWRGRRRCDCPSNLSPCGTTCCDNAQSCIENACVPRPEGCTYCDDVTGGFFTIDHGQPVLRACPSGTQCVATDPCSIVCDFSVM